MRPFLPATLSLLLPLTAHAHFQEILPQTDHMPQVGTQPVVLDLRFTHPMERGPVMDMGAPVAFGVLDHGKKTDLRSALTAKSEQGKRTYQAQHRVSQPGTYIYYLEPAPYWEGSEGKHIIHYSKVVVDVAGGDGWDRLVGLPVEIEPFVRPYGLWTGNLFRGMVRHQGKPVPFATIEIEWHNDGSITPPSDPFVTQIIKADASGQFAYAIPRAGWWGFAALVDGAPRPGPTGKPAPVELGGLMWVKAVDMK